MDAIILTTVLRTILAVTTVRKNVETGDMYANLDFLVTNLASLIVTWCFPKIHRQSPIFSSITKNSF